ncbi:MAG: hypothetical protein GWO39_03185, partial [Gammaproteobacteria bacterium]|nr:hypothetical protein [Gammaproteobacteria bacterium]NIT62827.1 hypothetical protein [Gammaproteobacteria bacterium]NIY31407.1 hypothetical protein [Gammaproteobacteria bacterium]
PAVAAALCLAWAVLLTVPPGATGQKRGAATIEMNFKSVDVVNFLSIMSKALDVPMVWDETKVRGSITLVAPRKFNREDALQIFEAV